MKYKYSEIVLPRYHKRRAFRLGFFTGAITMIGAMIIINHIFPPAQAANDCPPDKEIIASHYASVVDKIHAGWYSPAHVAPPRKPQ
jgi:hypothetical protein